MTMRGFFQDFIDYASNQTSWSAMDYAIERAGQAGAGFWGQLGCAFVANSATPIAFNGVKYLAGLHETAAETLTSAMREDEKPTWVKWTQGAMLGVPIAASIFAPSRYQMGIFTAGIAASALVSAYDNFIAPQPNQEEVAQIEQAHQDAKNLIEHTTERVKKSFSDRVRGQSNDSVAQPAR